MLSERQMIKTIISKTALHTAAIEFKNEETFANRKKNTAFQVREEKKKGTGFSATEIKIKWKR